MSKDNWSAHFRKKIKPIISGIALVTQDVTIIWLCQKHEHTKPSRSGTPLSGVAIKSLTKARCRVKGGNFPYSHFAIG